MKPFLAFRNAAPGLLALLLVAAAFQPASSQQAPGPPAVGVVEAARSPIRDTFEFMGRVEATDRVDLVARVNGFLEERLFTEGDEVKKGDLLYRLERPPYEAEVAARQAAIAQAEAQLVNAEIELTRATKLLKTAAGMQARVDDTLAKQRTAAAQLKSAQAAERQSQINLGYTEIWAPVGGRISRTAVTDGNVVGPSFGTLATIVSQDPMYVTFPVPMRTALDARSRFGAKGGLGAVVIRLRLPDGRMYGQTGTVNFVDVATGQDTDTLTFRGTVPNPRLSESEGGDGRLRELTPGEFVTVVVEAARPVEHLTIPRDAVLSDQRGDFVYVVGAGDKVERRAVQLGQSTPETAVILDGLKDAERVVVEGLQRIQPGMQVAPAPIDASINAASPSRS